MIEFQKSKSCEDYLKIVYRAGMLAKVRNESFNINREIFHIYDLRLFAKQDQLISVENL